MKVKLLHIGWQSKVMQKRSTLSITITKPVVIGCDITKGQILFCYLGEDEEKRPIMLVYLDGKQKNNKNRNGK